MTRIRYLKPDPRHGTEVELDSASRAAQLVDEGVAEYVNPAQAVANDKKRAAAAAVAQAEELAKAAQISEQAAQMAAESAAHARTAKAAEDSEAAAQRVSEAKAAQKASAKAKPEADKS